MNAKEKYLVWKNHPNLDPKLKEEIEKLTDKEIEDSFFDDIKFGTGGMRGVMGVGTNRINIHTIRKASLGFGNYLLANNKKSVAISYDNRFNSKEYAYDTANLLASLGLKVFLFDSLRPTPELSFAVRYHKCDGGIMITASHNPKEYNGYKIYDETGCQLIPEFADQVLNEIAKIDDILAIKPKEGFDKSLIHIINKETDEAYWNNVLAIQKRKDLNKTIKIAYSPEHGASFVPVMTCFKKAGYDIYNVESQSNPDPAFSNTKSPNPEVRDSYDEVLKLAHNIDADLFLVCDPDGDRMGVGVKHNGEYVILNGNQTGAILLEYILSTNEELGIKVNNPVMFNTIVTSDIGEAVARYHGVDVEKTLTGFKYIGSKVHKYENNHEKDYVFGYEESYGSLISPFVRDKDATQACLMLAEACNYYLTKNKSLYDVLFDIFNNVGAYYDSQINIMLPGADGAVKLKTLMENLRNNPFTYPGIDTLKIEDYKLCKTTYKDGKEEALLGYDVSDVLKYFLSDGSFIAIRPSGTEPKVKVYLSTKDETYEKAIKKSDDFKEFMSGILK